MIENSTQHERFTKALDQWRDDVTTVHGMITDPLRAERFLDWFETIFHHARLPGESSATTDHYQYELDHAFTTIQPISPEDPESRHEQVGHNLGVTFLYKGSPVITLADCSHLSPLGRVITLQHEYSHAEVFRDSPFDYTDASDEDAERYRQMHEWRAYTDEGLLMRLIDGDEMNGYIDALAERMSKVFSKGGLVEFDNFPEGTIASKWHKAPDQSLTRGIAISAMELVILRCVDPEEHETNMAHYAKIFGVTAHTHKSGFWE